MRQNVFNVIDLNFYHLNVMIVKNYFVMNIKDKNLILAKIKVTKIKDILFLKRNL